MTFLTEKEMETQLELASRDLPMPDGNIRTFTMMRIHWESADYANRVYSDWNYLLRRAIEISEAYQVDLDSALAAVATRTHEWIKKSVGEPLPVEPGICPLMHKVPHPYSYFSGMDAGNRRA